MLSPSSLGIFFHFDPCELADRVIFVDNSVAVNLQHMFRKQSPVRFAPFSSVVHCLNWPRSTSFFSLHFHNPWGEEQLQWVIQLV